MAWETRHAAFSGNSTADEVLEGVDLKGKRVFITGGHQDSGRKLLTYWKREPVWF